MHTKEQKGSRKDKTYMEKMSRGMRNNSEWHGMIYT